MEPTQNSENPIMPPPPVAQMPPPPVAQAPCCSAVPPCPSGGSVGNRKQLYLWGGIGAGVLGLILILVLCLFGRGVRVESDSDVLKWVIERQSHIQSTGHSNLFKSVEADGHAISRELSNSDVNMDDSKIYMLACFFDEVAIVRYLVEEKGWKVNPECLEKASEVAASEVCRYIIEEGLLPENQREAALKEAMEGVRYDADLADYLADCGEPYWGSLGDDASYILRRLCMSQRQRQQSCAAYRVLGRGPQTDEELQEELLGCARVLVEKLHARPTLQHVERALRNGLPELAEYLSSCM